MPHGPRAVRRNDPKDGAWDPLLPDGGCRRLESRVDDPFQHHADP